MGLKNVYKGSIETMVKIIDWTPINEIISKSVGEKVECRIGTGLIMDIEAVFDKNYDVQKRHIIVDNECCGFSTQKEGIYSSDLNNGEPFQLNLFKGVGFFRVHKDNKSGEKRVSMFPSYYIDLDSDDVLKCVTSEEMRLFEYMKGRYDYNPRIRGNEMGILRLVYYNHTLAGDKDWLETVDMQIEN